ncbi:hypothetical protein NDU88_002814 [Pleurodeles waltl]|uniref:Uncharacterized protein n=1 Tax=Pleurodeles waltl TaxID=8319 RepID=A0AAV7NHG8_PLEWA|nr:hypothetical protein NDU88_002814 [Pleurodeles waltl]
MGQCPGGAFPNLEAASQYDDLDIRKDRAKREEAARPEGEKKPTETPDKEEDAEPPGRGAETLRRTSAERLTTPHCVTKEVLSGLQEDGPARNLLS